MTDARWPGDDDDQRRIRSSSLRKKYLPFHHSRLASRFLSVALETLVCPTRAVVDLLAQNCQLDCHSHVAQLQLQLPLRGPLLLRWEGKHKFSANVLISTISREGWRPLTFFLRPAATSTVRMKLRPLNKLKLRRRGSSGIDCGVLG
jgi:hypothetical protein